MKSASSKELCYYEDTLFHIKLSLNLNKKFERKSHSHIMKFKQRNQLTNTLFDKNNKNNRNGSLLESYSYIQSSFNLDLNRKPDIKMSLFRIKRESSKPKVSSLSVKKKIGETRRKKDNHDNVCLLTNLTVSKKYLSDYIANNKQERDIFDYKNNEEFIDGVKNEFKNLDVKETNR